MFTQAPLQRVSPDPQVIRHMPPEHTRPAAHTFVHDPQCIGSLASSTHAPLHAVVPPVHVQVPPAHTEPAAHVVPQPPQLSLLEVRSTQVPLQFVPPTGQ